VFCTALFAAVQMAVLNIENKVYQSFKGLFWMNAPNMSPVNDVSHLARRLWSRVIYPASKALMTLTLLSESKGKS